MGKKKSSAEMEWSFRDIIRLPDPAACAARVATKRATRRLELAAPELLELVRELEILCDGMARGLSPRLAELAALKARAHNIIARARGRAKGK